MCGLWGFNLSTICLIVVLNVANLVFEALLKQTDLLLQLFYLILLIWMLASLLMHGWNMLLFLYFKLVRQRFYFLSQQRQVVLLCQLGSKAGISRIWSRLCWLRGRSLCSAPSDPIFSPAYQIVSRVISSNRRMILLQKTLPPLYQILKSLCWVSLLDQLLKLSIYSLLLPEAITAHWFVFPHGFSLRLILFREKVRDVFSESLNFFTNTFLRNVEHFFAWLVEIGVSATGVVIFIRVLGDMVQYPWLINFYDLSLLSTSKLSRFVFETLTTSMWLMTWDFLIWEWNLFGLIFVNYPLFIGFKLLHIKLREILIKRLLLNPTRLIIYISLLHLECRLSVLCRLTVHLTLLEVLPQDAQISEHHRLICCHIILVVVG
jgi:hypothetical protein